MIPTPKFQLIRINRNKTSGICSFLACEDDDTKLRALSLGIYNSCWQAGLLNSEKCKSSNEGSELYPHFHIAASCRLSCGHCKKDEKGMKTGS